MPSGAKKRKAAKKKQVVNNNHPDTAHSHGENDPKHQDDKESDVEEEEVEKREDTSSVRSIVSESRSQEGDGETSAKEEEGVVQIDRKFKSEEGIESKSVIIESPKELCDDDSSSGSGSSSSSDEESHALEEKTVAVETSRPVDSKFVDSLSEITTQVTDSVPVGEPDNSAKETKSIVCSDDTSLLEEVVQVNKSDLVGNSLTTGVVVDSGLKEIGEKKLLPLDENTGLSPKKGEEVVSTSDVKDSATPVNEDELLLSVNASRVETSNAVEHVKNSETPECSRTEPLVAAAPQVVKTTSWKSCCGIFELFSGSNR